MLLRGRRTAPVLTTGGNPTDSLKANRRVVKVPKGTSKYQAAWIVDDGEEGSEKDDDDEDDDMDDDLMEEAVSQVPPRADSAADLQAIIPCSGKILSFQLALSMQKHHAKSGIAWTSAIKSPHYSHCFFGLLDPKILGWGPKSRDVSTPRVPVLHAQLCVLTGSVLPCARRGRAVRRKLGRRRVRP